MQLEDFLGTAQLHEPVSKMQPKEIVQFTLHGFLLQFYFHIEPSTHRA